MHRLPRRLASIASITVSALIVLGCNTPPAKETTSKPTPTATTFATSTTSATAPSASVADANDAGPAPTDEPDTAPPPISTEKWATLGTAKKTIVLKYPADVFVKTKVVGDSIVLLSDLKRGLLGEGNEKDFHRYEIRVSIVAGAPFDTVKKEFKAYPFPQMFPKGTEDSFDEQSGSGSRATIGGHAGYRVWTGVEGYNQETTVVAIDAKKALRFQCVYVGGVMGPEIEEDTQVAICNAVLGSIFPAPAP